MRIKKPPSLKKHQTGQWFAKWGGIFHYFGTDYNEALKLYAESIGQWAEWRANRQLHKTVKRPLVFEVVEKFLAYKQVEGGIERRRYYENHLRRFNGAYADAHADRIQVKHLAAIKTTMIDSGYAPKTINHDLQAVKTLLAWASEINQCIPPVRTRAVKMVRLPPVAKKWMTIEQVRVFVLSSLDPVRPWLAVNYLTAMRPTEVVRAVNNRGEWETPWLFRLHEGKTDRSSEEFRRVVFSDEALHWLSLCRPQWTKEDSYYKAVCESQGRGGPHPLRHSAAKHLADAGVDHRDIDLLLGHLPPRVTRTYLPIDWQSLRPIVSRLSVAPIF